MGVAAGGTGRTAGGVCPTGARGGGGASDARGDAAGSGARAGADGVTTGAGASVDVAHPDTAKATAIASAHARAAVLRATSCITVITARKRAPFYPRSALRSKRMAHKR